MAGYMFVLEKYAGQKTRYVCPACNRRGQFTRYINNETGEYLADHVGRCNREDACSYHYKPKDFFQDNPEANASQQNANLKPKVIQRPLSTSFDIIPLELVQKSIGYSPKSHFHSFLATRYGREVCNQKSNQFLIGSSASDLYGTIFWQVDIAGNVRSGKVFTYDPQTGKRSKKFDWVHSKIVRKTGKTFTLKQCFFGEHQLTTNLGKIVAIVESEKTAVIASIVLPEYLWIATCGAYGCRLYDKNVSSVLLGRKVILFPDLNMYDRWKGYAEDLKKQLPLDISVSDLLERAATEEEKQKKDGYDLADYLLKIG